MRRHFHEANIVGVPCKRTQHCCATLRRSQNNRNVGTCCAKSLTGFKLYATSANKCQHCCGSMQMDATSHNIVGPNSVASICMVLNTFCTVWNKFSFCRQILWDFLHFCTFFENESHLWLTPALRMVLYLVYTQEQGDGFQRTSSPNGPVPFGSPASFPSCIFYARL